ncbi:MAG: CBS domain-containing protein [Betaproteobacteria bacterium]|nr:CBS domain-containing protein [Betaproteobacteria bacterium]NDC68867.1 CBS domain-containing protein [Betaproteobacteria bacterium]NDF91108.1 CBS domain-containing protein [Betaproteobacteria bacterium]
MVTVNEVLATKTFGLIHTSPSVSVKDAMALMVDKKIHCLVVFEDEKMCGIISDRDYAHKIVAKGLDPEQLSVGDIMTKNVITISREATIADCMKIMSERHFRHLPVAEGDAVVGMISMSDVMRVMMAHADDDEEWPM